MKQEETPIPGFVIRAEAVSRLDAAEALPRTTEACAEMLCQHGISRNRRGWHRSSPRPIGSIARRAVLIAFGALVWGAAGCASTERSLQVWNQAADFEHVSRYRFDRTETGGQWFARILQPRGLPAGSVYSLSDRFDFVIVTTPAHWAQMLKATNLDAETPCPDFSRGVVVGLTARVGETRADRWPALINTVRQRGRVAFLYGEFHEGFYRPLAVPPYLHLVYVEGVDTFLGVKVNQLMYGFNVEIDDLNEAGIR